MLDDERFFSYMQDAYVDLAEPVLTMSSEAGASYYDLAGGEGIAADVTPEAALRKSARWAMAKGDQYTGLELLSGSLEGHVYSVAQDSVQQSVENEPGASWQRVPRAEACPFCKLAAIDADLVSDEEHSAYHDHCRCVAAAIRPGQLYVPPDYFEEWQEQYQSLPKTKDLRKLTRLWKALDEKGSNPEELGAKVVKSTIAVVLPLAARKLSQTRTFQQLAAKQLLSSWKGSFNELLVPRIKEWVNYGSKLSKVPDLDGVEQLWEAKEQALTMLHLGVDPGPPPESVEEPVELAVPKFDRPDQERLDWALGYWVDGGADIVPNFEGYSLDSDADIKVPKRVPDRIFAAMVNDGERYDHLYRGIGAVGQEDLMKFQVGSELSMDLSSWSSDKEVADRFARDANEMEEEFLMDEAWEVAAEKLGIPVDEVDEEVVYDYLEDAKAKWAPEYNQVVFVTDQAQGLNIASTFKNVPDAHKQRLIDEEKEIISLGSYRVTKVEKEGEVLYVYLDQVQLFPTKTGDE
ncbi:capsid maturation protease [Gordonia phage Nina]|uniref:Capsid maturation protease n=1 Tax=Gordonia phage Nina TaxID=2499026 RepID=A0A3S9UN30_9CAUD|nr:capsid maturation protease [Gordonia phage Nina]